MTSTDNKHTIVDVRTAQEYANGHHPAAINIPLDEIVTRLAEFRQMSKPVVLYCRSGNRSGMAASILKQHGITEVQNGGGLEDNKTFLTKYD